MERGSLRGLNTQDNGLDHGVAMDVIETFKVDRYSIVTVWDVASGAAQRLLVEGDVRALAISPDSTRVAFGLEAGGKGLFKKGETSVEKAFTGHPGHMIHSVVFDRGGSLLLSSADDGLYKLWQVGEREALETFYAFGEYSAPGAFDPDGAHVVGVDAGFISRWAISPLAYGAVDDQMQMACQRLEARGVRGFTPQDKLEMPFLDDVPLDPCGKLGFHHGKPAVKTP